MLKLRQLVYDRQSAKPGRFCVGLDPDKMKIPESVKGPTLGFRAAIHMMGVVDATAENAAAFKPNRAHWEALPDGIAGLRMLIAYIHTWYPDIPVLLDCKRGDIDRTQAMYGYAHFVLDEADGANFSPYMGRDCLKQFINADPSGVAGLIALGRTSNPAAWEIQDAMLIDGKRVWERVVTCAYAWAMEEGAADRFGLVMGAAHDASLLDQYKGTIAEQEPGEDPIYSGHLSRMRELVGDDVLALVPGIGKQLGFTKETIRAAYRGPGTLLINQSSGMSQASMEEDWVEASGLAARRQCEANAAEIALLH